MQYSPPQNMKTLKETIHNEIATIPVHMLCNGNVKIQLQECVSQKLCHYSVVYIKQIVVFVDC